MSLPLKWWRMAVAVVALNHLIGLVGMNYPPTQSLFEGAASVNLLLSTLVVFAFHGPFNLRFAVYCLVIMLAGIGVEILGVHTGFPFGGYHYTEKFGPMVAAVPFILGFNWLLLSYSCSVVVSTYIEGLAARVFAGALLMTFLDFFLEPFAINHAYWVWDTVFPPWQNFAAWFVISLPLQWLYYRLIPVSRKSVTALPYLLILLAFLLGDLLFAVCF